MAAKDEVFYSLCEEDILEVAASLGVELTDDEMPEAKKRISNGMGDHWWTVIETIVGEIERERRESDGRG